MAIQIERRTGFYNKWIEYSIYLDGRRVTRIAANQKLELQLPTSPCQLKIKKEFQKGTIIEVTEGEQLIVKRNKWSYLMQFLYYYIILLAPAINFISYSYPLSTTTKLLIWISSLISYLILYITLPTITIIKKTPNS